MNVGDRIKFRGDGNRYEVQACDERFAVTTAPKEGEQYYYVLVDLKNQVRGPDDLLFGPRENLTTRQGADSYLSQLQSGRIGISKRNCLPLCIDQ